MVIFHSYVNVYQRLPESNLQPSAPWDDKDFGIAPKLQPVVQFCWAMVDR
jgi:hypothetical protein